MQQAFCGKKEELEYITSTRRKATYVQAAFFSVGTPHFDYMTTAAEAVNLELVELMAQLTEYDRISCQGDILLRLLDKSGNRVGSEIDQQMNGALVYSIHLNDLRIMVSAKKQVWVLSESRQKAKMIRAVM